MNGVIALPSVARLLECFDIVDDVLIWKVRPLHHFIDEWRWKIFCSRNSGKPAGGDSPQGYLKVKVDGTMYCNHRIIWKMRKGDDPLEIDHINGDRKDNSEVNMREVTSQQNCMNKSKPVNNTSGYKGVSWHKRDNCWQAYITKNGVRTDLGQFSDVHLAVAARVAAEIALFDEFRRIECEQ